jgi:hypothetical protein
MLINRVGVEKLSHRKFAEIASRQEALQTISPSRLDIFHHPIFHFFQKNRLFQQPQALSQVSRVAVRRRFVNSAIRIVNYP